MESRYDGVIKTTLESFFGDKPLKEEHLIKLFAYYINSNPDFKYNITYLTDSISPFLDSKQKLIERYANFRTVADKIENITPQKVQAKLIFDNFFQFTIGEKPIIVFELVNIDHYRFDKIDEKNYIVKFILEDKNGQYKTETYTFTYDSMINAIQKDKLPSDIGNNWRLFIK